MVTLSNSLTKNLQARDNYRWEVELTPIKVNLPAYTSRIFQPFNSVKHCFFKIASLKHSRKFLLKKSIHLNKKLYTTIFVVLAVLHVSFFIFFPVGREEPTDIPQETAGLSALPSAQNSTNTIENQKNETEESNLSLDKDKPVDTPTTPIQILPVPKPPGIVGSASVIDRTTWKAVAAHAWQYFQPELVNSVTGLPAAGCGFPYFTDWDLGVYLQAVMDAQTIGVIQKEGKWGADNRIEKVVTFLENRPLTNDTLPFWFYQAEDGNPYSKLANYSGTMTDTGRLLVALQNLKTYNYSLQTRIDNVVKNRMNYSFMVTELETLVGSNNLYDYFVSSGFAAFWPEKMYVPTSIINNIMSATQINVNGGTLPVSKISCEPILLSVFDLQQANPKILELSRQVYFAHEGWHNSADRYRAFSEGPTIPGTFAYEWIILPDGRTWTILDGAGSDLRIDPIIYSKVAFSFLALYNTQYARDMVVYLENSLPDLGSGYCDGIHEDGRSKVDITGSNTNGLIISAARYAIQSGDWP